MLVLTQAPGWGVDGGKRRPEALVADSFLEPLRGGTWGLGCLPFAHLTGSPCSVEAGGSVPAGSFWACLPRGSLAGPPSVRGLGSEVLSGFPGLPGLSRAGPEP